MTKLYFVAALCLATLACLARAADPIEAEIGNLKEELFDNPESRLTVDETLERLTRLESLVAPRADQHEQLLKDVRELVGYSKITDEKCRRSELLGRMFDVSAYTDAPSHTIAPYWAHQATRQLEHCRDRLNEMCEEMDQSDLEVFVEVLKFIKKEQDQAELSPEAQRAAMAKGVSNFIIKRGSPFFYPRHRGHHDSIYKQIKEIADDAMLYIGSDAEIFRSYQPVHGIRFSDARATLLARGADLQYELRDIYGIQSESLEQYMPKDSFWKLVEDVLGALPSPPLSWLKHLG